MPTPDLSSVRALIADERADARRTLEQALREIGVTQIDVVAGPLSGARLATLIGAQAEGAGRFENVRTPLELVARFSHDAASPLMLIVALTDLLARLDTADAATRDDLRQIHEAARQVADMVRTLGVRAAELRSTAS
jgi:hypothetical protein